MISYQELTQYSDEQLEQAVETDLQTLDSHFSNTLLHLACWNSDERIANALVAKKLDVNAKNSFGYTPLDIAYARRNMPLVENLLRSSSMETSFNCLVYAIKGHDKGAVEMIVEANPKIIIARVDGFCAIHIAGLYSSVEAMEVISEKCPAVLLQKDDYGRTVFHIALEKEADEMLAALMSKKEWLILATECNNDGRSLIDFSPGLSIQNLGTIMGVLNDNLEKRLAEAKAQLDIVADARRENPQSLREIDHAVSTDENVLAAPIDGNACIAIGSEGVSNVVGNAEEKASLLKSLYKRDKIYVTSLSEVVSIRTTRTTMEEHRFLLPGMAVSSALLAGATYSAGLAVPGGNAGTSGAPLLGGMDLFKCLIILNDSSTLLCILSTILCSIAMPVLKLIQMRRQKRLQPELLWVIFGISTSMFLLCSFTSVAGFVLGSISLLSRNGPFFNKKITIVLICVSTPIVATIFIVPFVSRAVRFIQKCFSKICQVYNYPSFYYRKTIK